MILNLSPDKIGITPTNFSLKTWGVVMETGMADNYFTLVALADGTTSLYFSGGGGIIGAGEKQPVREAGQQFIGLGNRYMDSAQPSMSQQPPATGTVKFFFLTFDGIRTYTAPEVKLGEKNDALWPLFHAGHAVIAAIRQAHPL